MRNLGNLIEETKELTNTGLTPSRMVMTDNNNKMASAESGTDYDNMKNLIYGDHVTYPDTTTVSAGQTLTLTADTYFQRLIIAQGGTFKPSGYIFYCSEYLDVAGTIDRSGPVGYMTSNSFGAGSQSGLSTATLGGSGSAVNSPQASLTSSSQASDVVAQTGEGGNGGGGGAGGHGTSTYTGGAARSGKATTVKRLRSLLFLFQQSAANFGGGTAGINGSPGAGNNVIRGYGAAGGGIGGGFILGFAKKIIMRSTGKITTKGGDGGSATGYTPILWYSGQAASGTNTTLTISTQVWSTNGYANMHLIITAGTGVGQETDITSNTTDTLTFNYLGTAPDSSSVFQLGPGIGIATSGSATTLNDTNRNWTTNEHVNRTVYIRSGTGAGQYATITANTATQLTVASWSIATPDTTSKYDICNDFYVGGPGGPGGGGGGPVELVYDEFETEAGYVITTEGGAGKPGGKCAPAFVGSGATDGQAGTDGAAGTKVFFNLRKGIYESY